MNMNEGESDLHLAVKQVLHRSCEGFEKMNFDSDVVCDEILCFIFRGGVHSNWCNRYEYLYEMQSKAVMVAQGWLLNCAAEVKNYRQTDKSIIHYIEKTYGVHHEEYAA